MKIFNISVGLMIGMFLMLPQTIKAQFEGQIRMNFYSYSNDGAQLEPNEMNVYITDQRILLKSTDEIDIYNGTMKASGLLIRSDTQDFVIMSGGKEALQFTKQELESMFSMITMLIGDQNQPEKTNINFIYTNKTRTIKGFKATELLFKNNEDNDSFLSIWLTNELDIDWGILSKPWNNVPSFFSSQMNQITQELKSRNFPLLIEVVKDETSSTLFEVIEIKKSRIAKDMVVMPAGLELRSLQELIIKAMMSN